MIFNLCTVHTFECMCFVLLNYDFVSVSNIYMNCADGF